jgi:hypothetical protein
MWLVKSFETSSPLNVSFAQRRLPNLKIKTVNPLRKISITIKEMRSSYRGSSVINTKLEAKQYISHGNSFS